jgi:hypothetical protein
VNPRSAIRQAAKPGTVTVKWCPVCGRTDRYQVFTGKSHHTAGEKCAGQPEQLTYRQEP